MLKRLRTDRIDLLYQHRVDPAVPIEDVAGADQGPDGARQGAALGPLRDGSTDLAPRPRASSRSPPSRTSIRCSGKARKKKAVGGFPPARGWASACAGVPVGLSASPERRDRRQYALRGRRHPQGAQARFSTRGTLPGNLALVALLKPWAVRKQALGPDRPGLAAGAEAMDRADPRRTAPDGAHGREHRCGQEIRFAPRRTRRNSRPPSRRSRSRDHDFPRCPGLRKSKPRQDHGRVSALHRRSSRIMAAPFSAIITVGGVGVTGGDGRHHRGVHDSCRPCRPRTLQPRVGTDTPSGSSTGPMAAVPTGWKIGVASALAAGQQLVVGLRPPRRAGTPRAEAGAGRAGRRSLARPSATRGDRDVTVLRGGQVVGIDPRRVRRDRVRTGRRPSGRWGAGCRRWR